MKLQLQQLKDFLEENKDRLVSEAGKQKYAIIKQNLDAYLQTIGSLQENEHGVVPNAIDQMYDIQEDKLKEADPILRLTGEKIKKRTDIYNHTNDMFEVLFEFFNDPLNLKNISLEDHAEIYKILMGAQASADTVFTNDALDGFRHIYNMPIPEEIEPFGEPTLQEMARICINEADDQTKFNYLMDFSIMVDAALNKIQAQENDVNAQTLEQYLRSIRAEVYYDYFTPALPKGQKCKDGDLVKKLEAEKDIDGYTVFEANTLNITAFSIKWNNAIDKNKEIAPGIEMLRVQEPYTKKKLEAMFDKLSGIEASVGKTVLTDLKMQFYEIFKTTKRNVREAEKFAVEKNIDVGKLIRRTQIFHEHMTKTEMDLVDALEGQNLYKEKVVLDNGSEITKYVPRITDEENKEEFDKLPVKLKIKLAYDKVKHDGIDAMFSTSLGGFLTNYPSFYNENLLRKKDKEDKEYRIKRQRKVDFLEKNRNHVDAAQTVLYSQYEQAKKSIPKMENLVGPDSLKKMNKSSFVFKNSKAFNACYDAVAELCRVKEGSANESPFDRAKKLRAACAKAYVNFRHYLTIHQNKKTDPQRKRFAETFVNKIEGMMNTVPGLQDDICKAMADKLREMKKVDYVTETATTTEGIIEIVDKKQYINPVTGDFMGQITLLNNQNSVLNMKERIVFQDKDGVIINSTFDGGYLTGDAEQKIPGEGTVKRHYNKGIPGDLKAYRPEGAGFIFKADKLNLNNNGTINMENCTVSDRYGGTYTGVSVVNSQVKGGDGTYVRENEDGTKIEYTGTFREGGKFDKGTQVSIRNGVTAAFNGTWTGENKFTGEYTLQVGDTSFTAKCANDKITSKTAKLMKDGKQIGTVSFGKDQCTIKSLDNVSKVVKFGKPDDLKKAIKKVEKAAVKAAQKEAERNAEANNMQNNNPENMLN